LHYCTLYSWNIVPGIVKIVPNHAANNVYFHYMVSHCVRVAGAPGVEERKAQRSYWEEHSRDLSVEAMMLDSRAAELDKEERPEVR
jgi:hypothetical protein